MGVPVGGVRSMHDRSDVLKSARGVQKGASLLLIRIAALGRDDAENVQMVV